MAAICSAPLKFEVEVKAETELLKVESEVGVLPQFMNMTIADEDEHYGSLRDFIFEKVAELKAQVGGDLKHFYTPEPIDLVWKGWEAAYIKSKGREAWQVATLETTGLGVLAGAHFKKVLGKRKSEEFSPSEEGVEEADEGLEDQIYKFRKAADIEPKEHAVALLAYEIMACFSRWDTLEELAGPDCGTAIRKSVFDCVVKFILSIFDEDDYYRICYWNEIRAEHMRFCRSRADKDAPFANLSDHKFTYFREADFYEACVQLNAYQTEMMDGYFDGHWFKCSPVKFRVNSVVSHDSSVFCYNENDVHEAGKLMQKHRPLKGCLQAQLMLELSRSKCFHVSDTLVLEAFKGLNLLEFHGKSVSEDSDVDKEFQEELDLLADIVVGGLCGLSTLKGDQLKRAENSLINGPQCVFGSFKDEVYEVIKMANHERRMENKRFTGLTHIWRALSFSRVRDCLPDIVNDYLSPELCLLDDRSSSEIYTYKLYELSLHIATELGEKVGLEHFVFSILYGSIKEKMMEHYCEERKNKLFMRLRESEAVSDVQSWRNIDVFTSLFGKRCMLGKMIYVEGLETLIKLQEVEAKETFVLPKNEDLRVM